MEHEETIEVEAVPLEDEPSRNETADALRGALGPLLAGMAIDLADLVTVGGLGAKVGLPLGCLCGWYLAGRLGLSGKRRLQVALIAGVYCVLPGTHLLPLGTLFGLFARAAGVGALFGRQPR